MYTQLRIFLKELITITTEVEEGTHKISKPLDDIQNIFFLEMEK